MYVFAHCAISIPENMRSEPVNHVGYIVNIISVVQLAIWVDNVCQIFKKSP